MTWVAPPSVRNVSIKLYAEGSDMDDGATAASARQLFIIDTLVASVENTQCYSWVCDLMVFIIRPLPSYATMLPPCWEDH